jgi:hypothetical protein
MLRVTHVDLRLPIASRESMGVQMQISGASSGPSGSRGFRWTISRKIAGQIVAALVLLGALGLLAIQAVSTLHAGSELRATLAAANANLIDLDMQESNVEVALGKALLATDDTSRQVATARLTAATSAAQADFAALRELAIPSSLAPSFTDIEAAYTRYLNVEQ